MPVLLERLDEVKFAFRKDAREDREVFWFNAVGKRSGRADCPVQPDGMGDDSRRRRRITGHHYGTHAQGLELRDECGRVLTWAGR